MSNWNITRNSYRYACTRQMCRISDGLPTAYSHFVFLLICVKAGHLLFTQRSSLGYLFWFFCVLATWSKTPTVFGGLWMKFLAGEAKTLECTRFCWKHRISSDTKAIPLLGFYRAFTYVHTRLRALRQTAEVRDVRSVQQNREHLLYKPYMWDLIIHPETTFFSFLYYCNFRFCVGDKFFLKNNMILCQTDYEEGLMKEGYAPQVRWSDATSLRIQSTMFFYLFCSTCI